MGRRIGYILMGCVVGLVLTAAPVNATVCKTILVGGKMCQLCCALDGTSCVVVSCN